MKQLKLGTIDYLFFSKAKLEQMSAVKLVHARFLQKEIYRS